MDWKRFFKPTNIKLLVALILIACVLPTAIFYLVFHGTSCIPPAPSMRCGYVSFTFDIWWIMLVWLFMYGYRYYAFDVNYWLISILAAFASYVLACALAYLYASTKKGGKKQTKN